MSENRNTNGESAELPDNPSTNEDHDNGRIVKERHGELPIVYNDINVQSELECLVKLLDGKLYKEEEIVMEELHQYLIEDDGCWTISDAFSSFVARILSEPMFSSDTKVHLIRVLANAALKDDVIILLHQNRKEHTLMNFAYDIDKLSPDEQQAWAIFICNLFQNDGPSEWLLYISEWEYKNQTISNIRVTTKLTAHCVLSNCPILKNIGTSILFNLAIKEIKTVVFDDVEVELSIAILQFFKNSPTEEQTYRALRALDRFIEVFDDVAVELSIAILQFFKNSPTEEQTYRALRALDRFIEVSSDVGSFIQMIGPHPNIFTGMSERVDALVNTISSKVPV